VNPVRSLIPALAIAVLFHPRAAFADSDRYYCAARGYVAYETRLSDDPPAHLLHVVRFSRAGGIVSLAPIPLPDFQVFGMRCQDAAVTLLGSTLEYTVHLADPAHAVTTRPARLDPRTPAASTNLGHWATPGVVLLEGDGSPGEFQLVIARVSRPVEGGIEHYTFTELVQRDPRPGVPLIVASRELFAGVFLETVD
jgi:hypothetical protein